MCRRRNNSEDSKMDDMLPGKKSCKSIAKSFSFYSTTISITVVIYLDAT